MYWGSWHALPSNGWSSCTARPQQPLPKCMNCACEGVCPESKKEYPGDCRLFYKCVPQPASSRTPGSAQAHLWIPIRCTAGLVYKAKLKSCVLPDEDWDCRNDDQLIKVSKIIEESPSETPDDATEDMTLLTIMPDSTMLDSLPDTEAIISNVAHLAHAASIQEESEIITSMMDITTVPQATATSIKEEPVIPTYHHSQLAFYVPNEDEFHSHATQVPYVDYTRIATQMNQIAGLVDSLKAVDNPPLVKHNSILQPPKLAHTFNPYKSDVTNNIPIPTADLVNVLANPLDLNKPTTDTYYEVNLLPVQLNKIKAQLVQTKYSHPANLHQTNLNVIASRPIQHGQYNMYDNDHFTKDSSVNGANPEQWAYALFNKYLQNKEFNKPDRTETNPTRHSYPEHNAPDELKIDHDNIIGLGLHDKDYFTLNKYRTSILPLVQGAPASVLPCITGIRFPNMTDCRRYYMCNKTSATIHSYTCPHSTAFNKIKRICDMAEYARCINAPSLSDEDSIIVENPIRSALSSPAEICSWENTKLADPNSHNHYIICIYGNDSQWKQIRISCPGRLVFCKHRNLCMPQSTC